MHEWNSNRHGNHRAHLRLGSTKLSNSRIVEAILLPGGILPAEPAYAGLLSAFGPYVDARIKDLEVHAGPDVPPPGTGSRRKRGSTGSPTKRGSVGSTSSGTPG